MHTSIYYVCGSKDPSNEHVGVGISIPEFKIQYRKRISNNVTIYTAELVAVYLGLY